MSAVTGSARLRLGPQVDGHGRIKFVTAGADRKPVVAGLQFVRWHKLYPPCLSGDDRDRDRRAVLLGAYHNSFHGSFRGGGYVAGQGLRRFEPAHVEHRLAACTRQAASAVDVLSKQFPIRIPASFPRLAGVTRPSDPIRHQAVCAAEFIEQGRRRAGPFQPTSRSSGSVPWTTACRATSGRCRKKALAGANGRNHLANLPQSRQAHYFSSSHGALGFTSTFAFCRRRARPLLPR